MIYIKTTIINYFFNLIKNSDTTIEIDQLEKIKYGLEGLYLSITKIIVITLLAILLNIFFEYLILLILFNIIRFTAFGIHASKSIYCWISSIVIFLGIPFICKYIYINKLIILLISLACILLFLLFAPSDTPKRPLINNKKRIIYKVATVFIAIIYSLLAYIIEDNFVHNALLASMIIEIILINPLSYKLFKINYNNYKNYEID